MSWCAQVPYFVIDHISYHYMKLNCPRKFVQKVSILEKPKVVAKNRRLDYDGYEDYQKAHIQKVKATD